MFKNFHIKYLVLMSLLIATVMHGQQSNTKNLQDKIDENYKLFMSEPNKAFLNTEILLEEATNAQDQNSELMVLSHRCWYYNHTIDMDNLISSAKLLKKKAIEYNNSLFQAEAHNYFLSFYRSNQLYKKAIVEFEKAMVILKKENEEEEGVIFAKCRAYIYIANLYLQKEEPKKALQYLFATIEESNKIKDLKIRKDRQYRNYSNIARYYFKFNFDSIEYYVQKSMSFKPEIVSDDDYTLSINYLLLGDVSRSKKNYCEALMYYHKAEVIIEKSSSNILNRRELFIRLEEVYTILLDTTNAYTYTLKLKEIDLQVTQSKYKSMHKILEDTSNNDNNRTYYIILIFGLFFICGITIVYLFRLKKKNKLLKEQEKKSEEYLETQQNFTFDNDCKQLYKDLIEMVEQNNPGFMNVFSQIFPNFIKNILAINPTLAQTEIEFCALLKLNLSTKQIAQIQHIQPKTVQNKKNRIRKRLQIPEDIDTYFYFNQL